MNNLIEITEENIHEIAEKIQKFVKGVSFKQTHDWINSPLNEKKTYEELTFDYIHNKYNSETEIFISKNNQIIIQNEFYAYEDKFGDEEEEDDVLVLAYLGDEIEFLENDINVISYGYGKDALAEDKDTGWIVVWKLFHE